MLHRLFANATPAHAHCDLYCGVYDPAQAKIEALSCLKTLQKYHDSDDEHFQTRAIIIKEQRAEEVKHHLMVLWADFFTKEHFEQFPNLHQLFWDGVHGAGDVKKSTRRRRRREAAQDDRRDRRHLLADREGQGHGGLPARLRRLTTSATTSPRLTEVSRGSFCAQTQLVQYKTISARMPNSTSAMTPARRHAISWPRV